LLLPSALDPGGSVGRAPPACAKLHARRPTAVRTRFGPGCAQSVVGSPAAAHTVHAPDRLCARVHVWQRRDALAFRAVSARARPALNPLAAGLGVDVGGAAKAAAAEAAAAQAAAAEAAAAQAAAAAAQAAAAAEAAAATEATAAAAAEATAVCVLAQ